MTENKNIENLIEFHQTMMNQAAMADSHYLYNRHREEMVKLQDEKQKETDQSIEGHPV